MHYNQQIVTYKSQPVNRNLWVASCELHAMHYNQRIVTYKLQPVNRNLWNCTYF